LYTLQSTVGVSLLNAEESNCWSNPQSSL